MVAITKKTRRYPCHQFSRTKIKPQSMIIIAMGMLVLGLLALEPAVVLESESLEGRILIRRHHQLLPRNRRMMLATSLPPPRYGTTPKLPAGITRNKPSGRAFRYGFAPKDTVRAFIMHPMDIFELGRIENRTYQDRDIASQDSELFIDSPASPLFDSLPGRQLGSHPRIVQLENLDGMMFSQIDVESRSKGMIDDPNPDRFESMSYSTTNSHQQLELEVLPYERPFFEECEPMSQPQVHPTCNPMHELTMEDHHITLLSTKGSWRTAWTVHNDTAVLKVLQWSRQFDQEAFQHHALDVIVSDVLTASPYVIDAYAYCGQSILQEWAPSGGRDFVKSYDIRNRQRLRIARDLARGLADLQALQAIPHGSFKDHDGLTSLQVPLPPPVVFSHNDINIANTIYADGRVKWNDFNIGILLRTKIGNSSMECGAPVKFRADLWRSPEEVRNSSYVKPQYTDIYGFGNILYQVMTRHQPWTHKEPEGQLTVQQVADRKLQGRLPTFPEQYRNTTNKDLQTLVLATMSCYHPNPLKRPTAYELAHALSYVYDRLQKKKPVPSSVLRELFLRK